MYQSHFHLHDRPFSSAANPEHYFPAGSIEQARESIARNVERASCVTIVTGPVGCGKTLLCQLISNQYAGELPVCLVQGERLNTSEVLLQSILHRLGLPFRGQDEGELRLILTDHISSPGCVNGILLIIDDADRLNTELLDEVRALTNIVKEGQPCARVLLVGSPRLDENIAHPELESLNQRIVGRLYLDSFSMQETSDYVEARIAASGGDGKSLFTADSLETVFRATNGVPRLVNQICDHALMLGSINSADQLTTRLIEEAWADLQQLPIPSASYENEVEFESGEDGVIEFGLLDDVSEANELVEIEQTLSDLGYEASKAARPIIVGGEIEFEAGHHEIKQAFSNPVLPIRSDSPDEDSVGGVDELTSSDPADLTLESDEAEATETAYFEMPSHDPEATIMFESESEPDLELEPDFQSALGSPSESETQSAEDVPSETDSESGTTATSSDSEFVFEISDDFDDDATSASPESLSLSVEEPVDPTAEEAAFVAMFESDSSDSDTSDETTWPQTLRVHDADLDSQDDDIAQPTACEFETSEIVEDEARNADEPVAREITDYETERESEEPTLAFEEDRIESPDGESSELESHEELVNEGNPIEHTVTPQSAEDHSPTMDQAVSPFGDGFSNEEVVIQKFTSPSQLARGSYDPVTTAYSQQLALQLAAAHPGLRMHPASEPIEVVEVADADDFQPLSACIDNDAFVGEDEVHSAADDPVMPETTLHAVGLSADVADADPQSEECSEHDEIEMAVVDSDLSIHEPSAVEQAELDQLAELALEDEPVWDVNADFDNDAAVQDDRESDGSVDAIVGVQGSRIVSKRIRKFRTLFSSMRGKVLHGNKLNGK